MLKFSGYPYLIRAQPLWGSAPERLRVPGRLQGARINGENGTHYAGVRPAGPRTEDSSGAHAFWGVCVRHDPTADRNLSGKRAALGRRRGFIEARTGMPPGIPGGAMCVQRFDDSLNSAIHITYRISLRSSSMREPRDPLLKVLTFCIVSQSDCGCALRCLIADLPRSRNGCGEATWKWYAEGEGEGERATVPWCGTDERVVPGRPSSGLFFSVALRRPITTTPTGPALPAVLSGGAWVVCGVGPPPGRHVREQGSG
jgi:hypothetical protein